MDVSDVKTVFRNPWSIEMFTRLVWTLQIDPKTVYKWIYEFVFEYCEKQGKPFDETVAYTFGHKKLTELLEMVSESKMSVVNGKMVMKKIIDGDERMPSEIAEDLGLVGTVVTSEEVRSTAVEIIAQNTDILDECIKEDDYRKVMTIVGKVMGVLNPKSRWDTRERIGDPVVIKGMCMEALEKRRYSSPRYEEQND